MLYYSPLICLLQAFAMAHAIPGHPIKMRHLHERFHDLVHRQAKKPDDITILGTQSVTTPLNEPKNTGSAHSKLETTGITSIIPFATVIPSPSAPMKAGAYAQLAPQVAVPTPAVAVDNIFDAPIDSARPPNTIGTKNDHPVPRKGIVSNKRLSSPVNRVVWTDCSLPGWSDWYN